jgi:hypothetical protein
MPNHFDSQVTVTGPAADIDRLIADLKKGHNCFCILSDPPPDILLKGPIGVSGDDSKELCMATPWFEGLSEDLKTEYRNCEFSRLRLFAE